jgi:hypothetical protein
MDLTYHATKRKRGNYKGSPAYIMQAENRRNFRTNLCILKLDVSLSEERLESTSSAHQLPRLLFVGGLDLPSEMSWPTICDIVSSETM